MPGGIHQPYANDHILDILAQQNEFYQKMALEARQATGSIMGQGVQSSGSILNTGVRNFGSSFEQGIGNAAQLQQIKAHGAQAADKEAMDRGFANRADMVRQYSDAGGSTKYWEQRADVDQRRELNATYQKLGFKDFGDYTTRLDRDYGGNSELLWTDRAMQVAARQQKVAGAMQQVQQAKEGIQQQDEIWSQLPSLMPLMPAAERRQVEGLQQLHAGLADDATGGAYDPATRQAWMRQAKAQAADIVKPYLPKPGPTAEQIVGSSLVPASKIPGSPPGGAYLINVDPKTGHRKVQHISGQSTGGGLASFVDTVVSALPTDPEARRAALPQALEQINQVARLYADALTIRDPDTGEDVAQIDMRTGEQKPTPRMELEAKRAREEKPGDLEAARAAVQARLDDGWDTASLGPVPTATDEQARDYLLEQHVQGRKLEGEKRQADTELRNRERAAQQIQQAAVAARKQQLARWADAGLPEPVTNEKNVRAAEKIAQNLYRAHGGSLQQMKTVWATQPNSAGTKLEQAQYEWVTEVLAAQLAQPRGQVFQGQAVP
jgi:hypothetical protein